MIPNLSGEVEGSLLSPKEEADLAMQQTKPRVPTQFPRDWRQQYQTQKRLADALFGLFRTLGTTLNVEHVAKVALLTLTGQLLVKRAAFFGRDPTGEYRILATVGARDARLEELHLPGDLHELTGLYQGMTRLLQLGDCASTPSLARLRSFGFETLFPVMSEGECIGMMALGRKVSPAPWSEDDHDFVDAFAVVMAVSLRNSQAYELMERSRNELQHLNDLKSEFLGHVSHEFRSPLTVLKGTLDLVEAEEEIVEMQRASLARLERLVNTVLILNEMNAGGVHLHLQVIDARTWVEERLRPLLERHGNFEIHADLSDCLLEVDLFKLEAALDGVADNAVKFTRSARHTEVHLYLSTQSHVAAIEPPSPREMRTGGLRPQAEIDPTSPDACLVIEVRDRGIGIPREDLSRIFQPFTQAENSPTRGVRGAGLGLAMARCVVEAHGGSIRCHSILQQGTTIYLIVPATRPVVS